MKGKLIKTGDRYILYDEGGHKMATTSESPYKKLSLKNCQAIELGYDLDEIKRKLFNGFDGQPDSFTIVAVEKTAEIMFEILGDKKFSEEDMREAIQFGLDAMYGYKPGKDGHTEVQKNKYIQSLQQTEWDVEIEMEQYFKYVPKSLATVYPTGGVRPKLDDDGCLILKRI